MIIFSHIFTSGKIQYIYFFTKTKWSLHYKFMNVIIKWLAKILKNITCGYGHHLWKYWIYHSWPSATCDKSNIFTRDDHNHSWYFSIFFASHILISQYGQYTFTPIILYHLSRRYFLILCSEAFGVTCSEIEKILH